MTEYGQTDVSQTQTRPEEARPATGPSGRASVPQQRRSSEERTGWVGWVFFAAVMALVVGTLQVIAGIVALLDEGYYVVTRQGLVVHMTYNEWGWIHIALGALLVGVGAGLLAGQMWARIIGVAVAALSLIANFLFLPAYPLWSVTMIAVDLLVIYAIAAHGREVRR